MGTECARISSFLCYQLSQVNQTQLAAAVEIHNLTKTLSNKRYGVPLECLRSFLIGPHSRGLE